MSKNIIVLAIGSIMVLAGLTAIMAGSREEEKVEPQVTKFVSQELGLSIDKPADVTAEPETDKAVKLMYLGPKSRPQTEITDGFSIIVMQDLDSRGYRELLKYAERRREVVRENGATNVGELSAAAIGAMAAYRFYYTNLLESTTAEYVFLPESGKGYIVSYTVSDPDERGYEKRVLEILRSLEFLARNE